MSLYRKERLESLIEELLGKEIVRTVEMADTLITITGVEVDEEHDKAIVRISVYPDEKRKDALIKLNAESGRLAWFLLKKIKIRSIPQLSFV